MLFKAFTIKIKCRNSKISIYHKAFKNGGGRFDVFCNQENCYFHAFFFHSTRNNPILTLHPESHKAILHFMVFLRHKIVRTLAGSGQKAI